MDKDLAYLLLICTLLILPKALQRFRIPGPLSCMALGIAASALLPLAQSGLVHFAAVLGIAALFLYAGLEVNVAHLQAQKMALLAFVGVRLVSIAALSALAWHFLAMPWQASVLLALAILTSSTGFILDSLDRYTLNEEQRVSIANEAITGELVALALMFVVLKADSATELGSAAGELAILIVALPLVFLALSRWVVPHAPGSQFSMLIVVALAAAVATNRLGAELLLGGFLTGLAASWLHATKRVVLPGDTFSAVKLFYGFFLPFYFMRAGTQVPLEVFGLEAAGYGLLLCLVLGARVLATRRRHRLAGASSAESTAVAVALMPSLIFTVVIAEILRVKFALPDPLYGGLLIYAFVNTLLPSLILRVGLDTTPAVADEAKRTQE